MQKIQEYTKTYTRNNCLLVQEDWFLYLLEDFKKNKNPYYPPIIYYVNDGIVDIWENKQAIKWFMDSILEINLNNKNFFRQAVKAYNKFLSQLEAYWREDYLKSIGELKEFLRIMSEGTKYFLFYYYSGADSRNPESIKKEALKIRTIDSYYDDSDRVIRNTVSRIYPEISSNLAFSLVSNELDDPPPASELKKRNKNCIFIPENTLEIVSLNEFLEKHANYFFSFFKPAPGNDLINGRAVYKGKINGRVQIIKHKSKIADFKEGNILVSPMTTPAFLPAMLKSAAIITDEGGITCHAAIIAREYKIPCIIGTKIATQVLKDGDLVEVDADRGTVKIIKRANENNKNLFRKHKRGRCSSCC